MIQRAAGGLKYFKSSAMKLVQLQLAEVRMRVLMKKIAQVVEYQSEE